MDTLWAGSGRCSPSLRQDIRATMGSLVGTYGQVGSDAHRQHRRRRSCMFEPLLSLNPHFARTMATASPASSFSLPALVVVGATTMVLASRPLASPSATGAAAASRGTRRRKTLPRDPDATTGQIHATSVRFQGFLGHDFHLTSKDYTYLNILAMFTMEPKTGYEVAPILSLK